MFYQFLASKHANESLALFDEPYVAEKSQEGF